MLIVLTTKTKRGKRKLLEVVDNVYYLDCGGSFTFVGISPNSSNLYTLNMSIFLVYQLYLNKTV